MTIGVIGLGIIGSRMAANWRKAGHRVLGWNRTAEHAAGLGLPLAASPARLAEASDVIMIVVADPAALDQVVSGPGGVATVSLQGKVVMNATTVDAGANRRTDVAVQAQGGRFVETPFTGSKVAADAGKLVFFTGGDAALVREMEPLLLQTAQRVFHFGPVGAGADAKLAFNLMFANFMQAMAESLAFARRAGLDLNTFVDAWRINVGWCGLAELKVPKMLQGDFSPAFSLKHMDKDLRLALQRGGELAAALPHTRHLKGLFEAAMAQGWGEEDFAALFRTVNREW